MTQLTRCKSYVIDPVTHRTRKCLNKHCKASSMMCATHTRKFVVQIQRAYRGYRTRRKIALFQKLPSELWNNVLYYTRYQHNIQTKFRKSVLKVFDHRLYYSPNGLVVRNGWPDQQQMDDFLNHGVRRKQLVEFFDKNDLIIT